MLDDLRFAIIVAGLVLVLAVDIYNLYLNEKLMKGLDDFWDYIGDGLHEAISVSKKTQRLILSVKESKTPEAKKKSKKAKKKELPVLIIEEREDPEMEAAFRDVCDHLQGLLDKENL